MSKAYLTEQERIDSVTLKIDDPSRIVGSGYIEFPPQVPFSQPLTRQPPTITGSSLPRSSPRAPDGRPQRQRQPLGSQSSPSSSYQQRTPQQNHRPQQASQPRQVATGLPSGPQPRQPHREQALQNVRRPQQNGYSQKARERVSAASASQAHTPAANPGSAPLPSSRQSNGTSMSQHNNQRSGQSSNGQISSAPPGLESAASKLSLEEKSVKEEPLSKAQAKRLRKKLREGRAEL